MDAHNLEIARIFGEIADLLEIKQESPFRVNAYRKAARALESLGEDVTAIAARGELRKIGGIGTGHFNNTAMYGSAGRLQGISQFPIPGFFDGAETLFLE